MASDTKNVKIGVCSVRYDGVDLGYTQGGVEVTVKTDTHKVNVDQFGKTPINEYIMGREVTVKCPLAETTLENLVAIMPGASLVATGGAVATGTITFATAVPAANDTLTINGVVFTYKTSPVAGVETDLAIPATVTGAAAALATVLNASVNPLISCAYYSGAVVSATSVLTVTYGNQLDYGTAGKKGIEGNDFTLAKSGANATVSGAKLTGGSDPTAQRVDVPTGIGSNLLDIAKVLTLHPVGKNDTSEDFTVFRAATAGALSFAYKLENERIFSCEFNGYPDPVTGKLFAIGDTTAA